MSTNSISSLVLTQIGPTVLGSYFGTLVYGSTIVQLIYYFVNYPKDSRLLKGLVSLIFALDSVQLAVFITATFRATVIDWGKPILFDRGPEGDYYARLMEGHTIPTDFIVPAVQVFWLWRIWVLGRATLLRGRVTRVLVFGSLILMVLSEFASMIAFSFASTILALRAPQLKVYLTIATCVMFVTDISLTIIMTLVLYRSRSGYHRTNGMLKNLILYVLANGSLTTAFIIAHLFQFLHDPEAWSWIGIFFVYERLYVSSFLASLNIRNALQNQSMNVDSTNFAYCPSRSNSKDALMEPLEVRIEVEKIVS